MCDYLVRLLELSGATSYIERDRNPDCVDFCRDLFDHFECSTFLLVGIAAGNPDKLKIGDVVSSTFVIEYERQSLRPGEARRRPRQFVPPTPMSVHLAHFNPDRSRGRVTGTWRDDVAALVKPLEKSGSRIPPKLREFSFHKAGILSGEKLKRDGTLPRMALDYHEQAIACDQESAGFALACSERKQWIVFRGISDYGDLDKRDDAQPFAALTAACAARRFLIHSYRKPDERTF